MSSSRSVALARAFTVDDFVLDVPELPVLTHEVFERVTTQHSGEGRDDQHVNCVVDNGRDEV